MSFWMTGGVAFGYAVGVVGLHRLNVYRCRRQANRYPALSRLDWDCLLHGLTAPLPFAGPPAVVTPQEGGPAPQLLAQGHARSLQQLQLLSSVVRGAAVGEQAVVDAGFTSADAAWLLRLAQLRNAPQALLEELASGQPTTAAEVLLREWLTLRDSVTPVSLEWVVFGVKRRLAAALQRFGEHPALYFVRAAASGCLGFTGAVLDDLARAVYFSRQAPFYVQAVVDMPFIEEERPALYRACHQSLAHGAT
jgi:hypothetical protein